MSSAIAPPVSWQYEQADKTETVEQLIRRAHNAQADAVEKLSASKLSRLIRRYIATHGIDSATVMVDSYCLTYADPTGETAIHNVMAVTR
jgi:hypothetical protein